MGEIHRNHPGVSVATGTGRRELRIALAAHQVGLECGAERIAFPADAVDLDPGFTYQGVIDGGHQRGKRRQVYLKLTEDLAEAHLGLHPVTRIQPVVGRPVLLGASAHTNQVGESPPAR